MREILPPLHLDDQELAVRTIANTDEGLFLLGRGCRYISVHKGHLQPQRLGWGAKGEEEGRPEGLGEFAPIFLHPNDAQKQPALGEVRKFEADAVAFLHPFGEVSHGRGQPCNWWPDEEADFLQMRYIIGISGRVGEN